MGIFSWAWEKILKIEKIANTVLDACRTFGLTISIVFGGALTQHATRLGAIFDDDKRPSTPLGAACETTAIVCDSFDISGARIEAIYDDDATGATLCSPLVCNDGSACTSDCGGVCYGRCGQGGHFCNAAVFNFNLEGIYLNVCA
jgi:hypothetical protein